MIETDKLKERNIEKLIERLQQSARDAVEGRTSTIEEVKDRTEGKE